MCINSINFGNILLPSRSTSRPLGKGSGRYVRKYIILLIYTDPAGHLDLLSACSNGPNLHLVTFTIVVIITSIQLTSL